MNELGKFSIVCLVLSVLAGIASGAWFGYVTWEANTYRRLVQGPMKGNRWKTIRHIDVQPGEHGQVGFKLRIRSNHVKVEQSDDDITYEPRYAYPVEYRVTREDGTVIKRETGTLTPESNRDVENRDAGPRRGEVQVYHYMGYFDLKGVESVNVRARMRPDQKFHSSLLKAGLIVYDGVFEVGYSWVWGLLLVAVSGLFLLVGLVLFLLDVYFEDNDSYCWGNGGDDAPGRSEQETWASICHLSALSMWVGVPFGNVLGPLIAWIMKKEEMSFVDVQGREALNFQISMMIYSLLALPFVIVLVGLLALLALPLLNGGLVVIAALKANDGRNFRYPLTIRFL